MIIRWLYNPVVFIVIFLVAIGVVAPTLVSASSTEAVVLGLVVVVVIGIYTHKMVMKFINSNK